MIGERLGNWVIDAELGRGGMANVYRAHEETTDGAGRIAAVKVLPAPLAQDAGFLTRFQREIDVLRQLDHPNIVKLYDAGTADGRFFYAMELIAGPNFEQVMRQKGRLPWPEVLTVAMQLSLALKHAHDRGIIHRDIKPSNLLLASGGREAPGVEPEPGASRPPLVEVVVKLSDFGIAKVFAATHLTAAGGVIGTPEYLSPEQATGKVATSRSDLYSLGVVLYALLTGRCPFEGETVVDLLHKHRYAQPERPSRLVSGLPHDLEAVILQLLDKDPSKRPADGMVLFKQLNRLAGKYARRNQETMPGLPPPPLDSPLVDSGDDEDDSGPGPATLMAKLMREELEREQRGGPVNRILNRWYVLVPLLLLVLGLIAWSFWPPSAESLFQRGAALMASDDPADWERGWTDYLERLERDHPGHGHADEVRQFRRRYEDYQSQREADRIARDVERAARVKGSRGAVSEGHWFYQEGLRLRQIGDAVGAERVWRGIVTAFKDVPAEKAWVLLAERELAHPGGAAPEDVRWSAVRESLESAERLRAAGKIDAAKQVCQALENLYRDDPSARSILDEVRQLRLKLGE